MGDHVWGGKVQNKWEERKIRLLLFYPERYGYYVMKFIPNKTP